eukprot:1514906-Rhodomonas_salina.2
MMLRKGSVCGGIPLHNYAVQLTEPDRRAVSWLRARPLSRRPPTGTLRRARTGLWLNLKVGCVCTDSLANAYAGLGFAISIRIYK